MNYGNLWNRILKAIKSEKIEYFDLRYLKSTFSALKTASGIKEEEKQTADAILKKYNY